MDQKLLPLTCEEEEGCSEGYTGPCRTYLTNHFCLHQSAWQKIKPCWVAYKTFITYSLLEDSLPSLLKSPIGLLPFNHKFIWETLFSLDWSRNMALKMYSDSQSQAKAYEEMFLPWTNSIRREAITDFRFDFTACFYWEYVSFWNGNRYSTLLTPGHH